MRGGQREQCGDESCWKLPPIDQPPQAGALSNSSHSSLQHELEAGATQVARSSHWGHVLARPFLKATMSFHDELDLLDLSQNEAEQQADEAGLTGFDRRQFIF